MSKRSKANEVLRKRRAAGRNLRTQIEGEESVKAADAKSDAFLKLYYDAHDEFCWGSIWTRPSLSIRIRSVLALALTAAKNQTSARTPSEQPVRSQIARQPLRRTRDSRASTVKSVRWGG